MMRKNHFTVIKIRFTILLVFVPMKVVVENTVI
ncbi:MAG: hypothetical protein PG977_000804 [Bartonella clarridgeiae]|nr:MAG: hypothetical protein PG977_000804 [Bartonella clarridgeiae]